MKYLGDFSGKEETVFDLIDAYGASKDLPAISLFFAHNALLRILEEENMLDLYYSVELPLADVLFDMELSGFKVDYESLSQTGEKYKILISSLEKQRSVRNISS